MRTALLLILALAMASCTPFAAVKVIHPQHAGFPVAAGTDTRTGLEPLIVAAEDAMQRLEKHPSDTAARDDYNFAVARIIGALQESGLTPWTAPVRVGQHTLAWESDRKSELAPADFEFIPSDTLAISGKYMDVRETKAGLGAPMVAKRIADQAHELAPTPHFYFNVTAIARFDGNRCVISMQQALEEETVRVGGRTWPLAADYTAPLAMMLVEMEPEGLNIPRLLRPAEFADTTKISRLEPYDPDKIVVLLVHGLASSPTTWFPLLNHLRADQEIRDHYQFWFYSYPSGYPYPYSAAIMRKELDAAEKRYPSDKKMVVIGHSMGGCISHILATDSGNHIWDKMYTVPPEQMKVSPEERHILTESAIFSHRPEIGRIIFISTPHRGSDLANNLLGQVFTRLVRIPSTLMGLGIAEASYLRTGEGTQHLNRFPDSVDTLAPDNSFVVALNELPIHPDIVHHTIAGDRGKGNSPHSSDGVVPYWSSHRDSAKSELIVPSGHGAHHTPEAIAEVERILVENLHSSTR